MRTTPNPGIPRRPTALPVQKRPNEMDEGDDVRHTKRWSSHWEYRDGCGVLLWANTTRRPTELVATEIKWALREYIENKDTRFEGEHTYGKHADINMN
jgi:hypothetical protein